MRPRLAEVMMMVKNVEHYGRKRKKQHGTCNRHKMMCSSLFLCDCFKIIVAYQIYQLASPS